MLVMVDKAEVTPELLSNHHQISMNTMFVIGEGVIMTINKTLMFCRSVPIKAGNGNEYIGALHWILQYNTNHSISLDK